MVNDVLQKHKAFWHPGRGSPYQLNLLEGRARREFPSSSKHHYKDDDENFYYPTTRERRKQRKNTPRSLRGTEVTPDREMSGKSQRLSPPPHLSKSHSANPQSS